jgi:hypothetical protein
MQYLKILHDRYGDIEVKIKTTYETMGTYDYDEYTSVVRPNYDKNNECVVIHKEIVNND